MAKKGKKTTAADGFVEQSQTMTFAQFVEFLPEAYRGKINSAKGYAAYRDTAVPTEYSCDVAALGFYTGIKGGRDLKQHHVEGNLSSVNVVLRERHDERGQIQAREIAVAHYDLRQSKNSGYTEPPHRPALPLSLREEYQDGVCVAVAVSTKNTLTTYARDADGALVQQDARPLDHAQRMAARNKPADSIDWRPWIAYARSESRSWHGHRRSGTNHWDFWADQAFASPLWDGKPIEVAQTIDKSYGAQKTPPGADGIDFYEDLDKNRARAKTPDIALVRDMPAAKPYVLESKDHGAVYLWGNEHGEIARRITALNDGRICDETFSGNTPALMIVYDPQKQVVSETRYQPDGVTHEITRHAYGEEHVHRKDGQPHNLNGAWRYGVDANARTIAPQYFIEGQRYSAMTYFSHAGVTATRPPLLQSFAAAARRLVGQDGPIVAVNAPDDVMSGLHGRYAAARLDWILSAQEPEVRRDVIAKVTATFYDHPAAADLRAQRGDEVQHIAQHDMACRAMAQAVADADTYVQQLARQRDTIAKTPLARDYFDSMITRIEDAKQQHGDVIARATAAPDARGQAALTQAESVVALVVDGVISGHQPAGAREVLDTLHRHHAGLPDLGGKIAAMNAAADALRQTVDGLKTELRDGLTAARTEIQTAERYIELQSDDVFSQAVSAPAKPAKLDR